MSKSKLLVATVAALFMGTAVAGSGGHWGYEGHEGPAHWGELSKDFAACQAGKAQSPVDIAGAKKGALKAIEFHYSDSPLSVVNNGHTIQANYAGGSYAVIGGKRYDLLQFHFHTPSENTVGGKPFPMEVHLVHKSADGQLAVVGVMLKEGKESAIVRKVWAHMPAKPATVDAKGVNVNAAALLPANKAYYNFAGSLTTPPCSEGVNWNVMADAIEVSGAQVAAFRKLFAHNARPVQPLNGRAIQVSNR